MFKSLLLLIACAYSLNGTEEKKICLNMVVRNESKNILSCLSSVKKIVDYWVIVDAGSTDGTPQAIREFMHDVPGELHERTWTDVATNGNEALALAAGKGDYLLILNGAEQLRSFGRLALPPLDKDCYFIQVFENGIDSQRVFLIDSRISWRWEGALPASLVSNTAQTFDLIKEAKIVSSKTDIQILEEALALDPTNPGHLFHLAQSYRAAKEYEKALHSYQKRATMGGWEHEVFWSLYQTAILQQLLKMDPSRVMDGYYKAHQYNPTRAEPLYRLANCYLQTGRPSLGYSIAKQGLAIPFPSEDRLFTEEWIYEYGLLLTLADCAFELKKYQETKKICREILAKSDVPLEIRNTVTSNLQALENMGAN